MLDEYQTLENIISHEEELKGKVYEAVHINKETGLKCKFLATIKTDCEVPFSMDEINKKKPNIYALKEFYKELDFY